jgi:hypothetical protein
MITSFLSFPTTEVIFALGSELYDALRLWKGMTSLDPLIKMNDKKIKNLN